MPDFKNAYNNIWQSNTDINITNFLETIDKTLFRTVNKDEINTKILEN
jgi:hypothetical protein